MGTFAFRLRFSLPHAGALRHPSEEVEVPLAGHERPAVLRAHPGGPLEEAKSFVLTSTGFGTRDAAEEAGERLRRALRLSMLELRSGVDATDRPSTLGIGKVLVDQAREMGFDLRGDPHGLTAYADDVPIRWMSVNATGVVSSPVERHIERLAGYYETQLTIDEKLLVGIELYNSSFFESSLRARFVTLVVAIEAAAPQHQRSAAAREHIDRLVVATRESGLADSDKKTLADALSMLQWESITTACRAFVDAHGQPGDAGLWQQCHKARHSLLHTGVPPKGLRDLLPRLDELVRHTLLSCVAHSNRGAA